jgi:hypothetical protein
MSFSGQPAIELKTGDKNKTVKVKKIEIKKALAGDARLRTKSGEFIVLNLNDHYELIVLPESNVLVTKSLISVADGRLYLKQTGESHAKVTSGDATNSSLPEFQLSSEFFQIPIQNLSKLSLLIDISMKNATLDICNLGSDFNLALYDDLNPQSLKLNEGVQFQSSLTPEGRIAYDVLLEKRKAPKGQWAIKKACSRSFVDDLQKKVMAENQKKAEIAKANKAKSAALKKKNDSQFLCQSPYAQLNECRFILRQVSGAEKCFRERCNAEGKWAETIEINRSKDQCSIEGVVSLCGY